MFPFSLAISCLGLKKRREIRAHFTFIDSFHDSESNRPSYLFFALFLPHWTIDKKVKEEEEKKKETRTAQRSSGQTHL